MLTPQQIRSVRLKNAEPMQLERLELKLLVVIPGSAGALLIQEQLQEQQAKGANNAKLFPLFIRAGVLTETGEPLSEADVTELMSVLSLDELMMLIGKVNEKFTAARPQKASPTPSNDGATSNTVSASPSAGPTPTS